MKMKKIVTLLLLAGFMAACGDDDNDSQPANNNQQNQEQTNNNSNDNQQQNQGTNGSSSANDSTQTSTDSTAASSNIALAVTFSGSTATIDGETDSLSITQEGANVTITSVAQRSLDITLKGSTTNGSLMVFAEKKYALTLDNVTITNPNGPAINNQCSKALTLTLKGSNTLADGTTYTNILPDIDIDQKGTLFSEGQIYVQGSGTLTINGNAKNGMVSDDYIVVESGTIQVSMSTTASNGIKVNDGFDIKGGTLTIDVKAKGARGIKSDAYATFNGGTTTITTSGDCLIETVDGVKDTTSCAGIKCDSMFVMNAGTLTITSTGDGGKGINSAQNIEMNGGTLTVTTKGSNDEGKPKAVKSDTAIILRGGSFTASTAKSWACDNGTSSDDPNDHQTIVGTPGTKSIAKKQVKVIF